MCELGTFVDWVRVRIILLSLTKIIIYSQHYMLKSLQGQNIWQYNIKKSVIYLLNLGDMQTYANMTTTTNGFKLIMPLLVVATIVCLFCKT